MDTIRIAENLEISDGNVVTCSRCGHKFGSANENWKTYALRRSRGPKMGSSLIELAEELGIFEYVCPECGVLLDVEIAREEEDPLWDVQLRRTSR